MSIQTPHPLYSEMLPLWELGTDSYEGAYQIKSKGSIYLPATSGMRADGYPNKGTEGEKAYDAYITRAYYPDVYEDAVDAAVGTMTAKAATIDLPAVLEPMRDNATLLGEPLQMLLRRIYTAQLTTGRLGLLADIRTDCNTADGRPRPVVVTYAANTIRNWDDTCNDQQDEADLRFLVLDESQHEMQADFSYQYKKQYRLLSLMTEAGAFEVGGTYSTSLLQENETFDPLTTVQPSLLGTTLQRIPFTFINAADLAPSPAKPPLLGLANLALTIYRGEADYRQNLFMQGQDTLVKIGAGYGEDEDEITRTGAGASINLPLNGDAKYIGVSSNGLPEQRQSLAADYERAAQKGAKLLTQGGSAESGDALRIRIAAQTATLPQIAHAGAAGLEKVLKALAEWYGADPDEVAVRPNLDFSTNALNGQTLLQIVQAKELGAPISTKSIHAWLAEQGFTKMDFEAEQDEIEKEPDAEIETLGAFAARQQVEDAKDLNEGEANDGE